MASTNHTANYDLSQYLGGDKPTYLGDYNSDMFKIDTALKGLSDDIDELNTDVGVAQTTANSANTTANTADGKADNAQETADANTQSITNLTDYLNINTYKDLVVKSVSNATITKNNMRMARNSDGTLGKVYGSINFTIPSSGTANIVLSAQDGTGFSNDEDITINAGAITYSSRYTDNPLYGDFHFNTDGDIEITYYGAANENLRFIFPPCLYFIKNFGDTPTI